MSKTINIKQGFNINLAGKAKKSFSNFEYPETYAVKPTDFQGIERPKLLVKEGDEVKAGTPVFFDKKNEKIKFTAPVSGKIAEIKRGEKRKILEIKILADQKNQYSTFPKYTVSDLANLTRKQIIEGLLNSGVWPNFIQMPFAILANPDDTPKAIFVSCFDSHPLAPDYDFLFKGEDRYFQAGINLLIKLTPGKVHLNINANAEISPIFTHVEEVEINKFTGPHPTGNAGIQIHHIDPIKKGDIVWTIRPFGVIQIGKLFLEGKYDAAKIVAVAGSEIINPQYYQTYTGACINKFVENNLISDPNSERNENVRFISGNVLTGEKIERDGYLGFYHDLLTVIPEGNQYEFFGWILPSFKKLSFQRAIGLFSFLNSRKKEYIVNTNLHGEERPFVQSGVLERVLPMDIYPTYLLKAIIAKDYDGMEALGILEVAEEDFALCEFIDVSKNDIQAIIREGIELIRAG